MNRILLLALIALLSYNVNGQKILQQYVDQAIQNNLQVKEKKILESKQELMVEEASRYYRPEINFMGNYTLAAGGRSFDLPIGTLLNPIYSTLNDLTDTHNFPSVENQKISFLPDNFYNINLRITQPILHPEIKYNKLMKQEEANMSGLQTDQTKRDLIRDIKTAYFRWMQANDLVVITEQGLTLLNENKRITESLIKNGESIPSALMRIESDIDLLNAQQTRAQTELNNAATWFNFLLHQPANTPIVPDTFSNVPAIPVITDVTSREELQEIKSGQHIQELALTLEQKHYVPKLGAQVDVGSQAYGADWGGYVLGGLQLDIPIWDNKISKLKQQQWQASIEANETSYEWAKQAFETQLTAEIENLKSDISIYDSYSSMLISDNRYYQETVRRYKEGLTNYIDLLDARTDVTNTQIRQNVAKYQSWIRLINIERMAATAPIQ